MTWRSDVHEDLGNGQYTLIDEELVDGALRPINARPLVVHIASELGSSVRGGAGVAVSTLANWQFTNSVEFGVAAIHLAGKGRTNQSPRLPSCAVPTVRFDEADPSLPLTHTSLGLAALGALGRARPRLVHSHSSASHLLAAEYRRTAPHTIHVATLHSLELLRPWRHKTAADRLIVDRELEALAAADAVIAVSEATRADYLRAGGDRCHVHVIPNGINTVPFTTQQSTAPRQLRPPYRVLFVGRISHQKGWDTAMEVLYRLPIEYHLVLRPGPAEDELELRAYRSHIRELRRLGRPVEEIADGLSPEELAPLYSSADVLLSPSRYEPFGLVNLESLLCGTPVVATNTGGIPEVVEHGVTGYLVDDRGDSDRLAFDMAAAVCQVIKEYPMFDTNLRSRVTGLAARFDRSTMADRVSSLYQDLGISETTRRTHLSTTW